MKSQQHAEGGRRIAGRAQQDHILDPYQVRHKPHGPAICRQCGVIYHDGRWQWGPRRDDAAEVICPACRRIAERAPAGILTLHGDVALRRKNELTRLAHNQEEAEKGEHPLNRIAAIEQSDEGLVVTTTDIHLPRRIGEAVKRAFHGSLVMHFDEDGYFARVDWHPPG